MFVPIIPVLPNTNIVNRNIVYNDTVLSIKELGENIKVSTISDVSEFSLEKCLKIIFESNPDVVFNTIQYSRKNKKVYFYTNKDISINKWLENNTIIYKPVANSSEILEEIKNILSLPLNSDSDCISLYDIAQLTKLLNSKYEAIKTDFYNRIETIIQDNFGISSNLVIYDFNYEQKELHLGFKYWQDYNNIIFAKQNNDLYIKNSESYIANEILNIIGNYLSDLYDEFIKYEEFKTQSKLGLHSINSNFLIDISSYGVDIFIRNNKSHYKKEFELSLYSYTEKPSCNCNSNTIINTIKGNEELIFSKIFIKLEDCPKWSQQILYELRQAELYKEEKVISKTKKKRKKLFSFFK